MPLIDVYRVHLNPFNTFPLALGNIVAMVKRHKPELLDMLNFETPWLTDRSIIKEKLQGIKPAIFLISDYVWNLKAHNFLCRALKDNNPNHIIIRGGPSIPYHDSTFLEKHEYVDFTVNGEGEATCMELIHQLCTEKNYAIIKGISFRNKNNVVMTEERERIKDLSIIPSPYLTGEFGSILSKFNCAVVETNRGCPYKCAYCAWGGYLNKVIKYDLLRIFEELEWICSHNIPSLWIADANFGILEQDIAIAEHLCKLKAKYGSPKNLIITYANNKTRTMEISRLFIEAKILTSLSFAIQTSDDTTLRNINRKPISNDYFRSLRDEYVKYQLPVMIHLMMGLPGSTYKSFKHDINLVLEEKTFPHIFTTVILENTTMTKPEYRKQHGIITEIFKSEEFDEEWEVILATNSFSKKEYKEIHLFCAWVHFAVCYRTLKYITYFTATELQILQVDVLEIILNIGQNELFKDEKECRYPILKTIVKALTEKVEKFFEQKIYMVIRLHPRDLFLKLDELNQWDQFYNEIFDILHLRFGLDSEMLTAVIKMQKSILPSKHNPLHEDELPYDFVSYYFQDIGEGQKKSLEQFKYPIHFAVKDPKNFCNSIDLIERSPSILLAYFELDSPLWRNE
ncbi:MAG: radical SAM protein [Desulfobacterales bacterium]|nr:radical SAM protein [Desulfobacterales bacterium]